MRVLYVGIAVSLFGSLLLACETPRGEPITIHTSAPPTLVAYREDASNQWRRLDATSREGIERLGRAMQVVVDRAMEQDGRSVEPARRTRRSGHKSDARYGGSRS